MHPSDRLAEFCNGDLDIHAKGVDKLDDLANIVDQTLEHSVKTDHPHFLNALYHGTDFYGKIGGYVSEVMNTNGYSYEVGPLFTLVEKNLIKYTVDKVGWISGDGLTCPGGSLANIYAMVMARHYRFPDTKRTGISGQAPMVIFTSEESHYSVAKGASWTGIGLNNVIKVTTNKRGQMIPEELEKAIVEVKNQGKVPLMVNATLGSTVIGAFDDVVAINQVLDKFRVDGDIWLHADAAWGGGYLLSPKLKAEYISGSHLCDSFAWNPHKMIGAPLQASIFVYNNQGPRSNLLNQANCASASYLFQQDKFYDVSYDTGDKSVQCGRKTDAFKVWFMLKARGEDYFTKAVEQAHDMSRHLVAEINSHGNFEMVLEPSCTNVNFVYIPPRLKEAKGKISEEEWSERLSKVAPVIKERMMKEGTLMVAYQPLNFKGLTNFFRMVFHCQPLPTKETVHFVLNEIDRLGKNLY